jgi:hypothetical protein
MTYWPGGQVSCADVDRVAGYLGAVPVLSRAPDPERSIQVDPERSTWVSRETLATRDERDVPRVGVPEASARSGAGASVPRRVSFDAPIETKLHAPTARKEWVQREELVDYLAGATARILLIDARAGFGKTTLVARWRSSPNESRSFGWVSLDPRDNDPGRLWRHVVCAVPRACPKFDADIVLSTLRTQTPDFAGLALEIMSYADCGSRRDLNTLSDRGRLRAIMKAGRSSFEFSWQVYDLLYDRGPVKDCIADTELPIGRKPPAKGVAIAPDLNKGKLQAAKENEAFA